MKLLPLFGSRVRQVVHPMLTKTIRSRFSHEVGENVEDCKILEKRVVIPPDPVEKRRGVYEYLVEAPPLPVKARATRGEPRARTPRESPPERGSFTRSTPEEMGGRLIRRLPPR
jgi:hypothetical protein